MPFFGGGVQNITLLLFSEVIIKLQISQLLATNSDD